MTNLPPLTEIEVLKKAIRYRAEHRGTKEADWLIGGFIRTHLADFSEEEIYRLKSLIDLDDEGFFKQIAAPQEPYLNLSQAFQKYKSNL
ncbi:MAG: succinate dehydrogenase assembly factor 2 [Alphaproteobacteria bacterium]|nr:succinate dehydrogenase assembly factor 2 [Alphaproteobacteria bacterium]NCQ67070.1 succinate dehydrogenase assembly factor 2 [Alphaproteobacteria bacterium]NCT07667.1 succinate dehydrogenase assembly factor 2 [Alphaproteobacteria bacterium]